MEFSTDRLALPGGCIHQRVAKYIDVCILYYTCIFSACKHTLAVGVSGISYLSSETDKEETRALLFGAGHRADWRSRIVSS